MSAAREPVPLCIGELKEALISFTDLGGAWGSNLSENKPVLLRVHGHVFALSKVSATFLEGRFAVVLDGETADGLTPPESDAAQLTLLARVRAVLYAFDWEHDDRQYALEKITGIVFPGESEGGGSS